MQGLYRILPQSVLTVLVLSVGCKQKSSDPQPVVVQVISDTAEIEAARKAWVQDRERKLASLLQEPENIRPYDEESIALIRGPRERSKAALERVRDDPSKPANTRIAATYALKLLDVPPSAGQLAQLGRMNDEAAKALLFELRSDDVYPDEQPLPNALKQFVLDCLGSKSPQVRRDAAHLAASRTIAEAGEIILQEIRQQREPDLALSKAAARLRPSTEVLERLQEQLKQNGPFPTGGALGAMADLSEAAQEVTLKEKAARACAEYLQREADHPWLDSDTMSAIDAIAAVQPPKTAGAMLQNLVRSGQWRLMRESALTRLERIDPNVARQIAAQTGLRSGSEARTSERRSQSLSLQQLVNVCTRHGVLTTGEAQRAIAAYASQTKADQGESPDVLALLHFAGRFLAFDVETGMVQNRHDLLIGQFAEASAGLFRPEAALEHYDDPDAKPQSTNGRWVEIGKGRYTVQFIHQEKLYRFAPNDLGDWYDVRAVLKAIHQALADAAVTERFVSLASGGQDAQFIFGKPEAVQGLAKELGLPLESDPDSARRTAKAYEEKALEGLRR